MLSVAVHKDIAEYQPKIIGKLTLRTLLCIVCAVGISLIVGLYLYFVLGFDPTDFEVLILAISMPFWAMGFWRPRGMKAETFAKYWIEYNFTRKNISHMPWSDSGRRHGEGHRNRVSSAQAVRGL